MRRIGRHRDQFRLGALDMTWRTSINSYSGSPSGTELRGDVLDIDSRERALEIAYPASTATRVRAVTDGRPQPLASSSRAGNRGGGGGVGSYERS